MYNHYRYKELNIISAMLLLILFTLIFQISVVADSDLLGTVDPYPEPQLPLHWLVDSQGVQASIIVSAGCSTLETYAAQEISDYVEKITGLSLPILTIPDQDYYPIYVGQSAKSRLNYPDWSSLGDEGFVLTNSGVYGIYIAGDQDLGTLYGVYHFIEKHLQVRWFMPDEIGEVVPQSDTLTVGTFDEVEKPSFKVRWVESGDWALKQKMNVAVSVDQQPVGVNWWCTKAFHTHLLLILPSLYYDDHPEWFALINGVRRRPEDGEHSKQLCTSNPQLIQEMANNIIQIFNDDPSLDIIHLSPMDGGGFCECTNCTALDEDLPVDEEWHGLYSNRLAVFHNQVANLVAQQHPDKIILTGAYAYYLRVPKAPDFNVPSNIGVEVCHTYSCNNHRVALPTCRRNRTMFAEELLHWSELTDHLFIYEYYRKGAWGNLPLWQIHVIRKDIPYFHSIGVEGFYTQAAGNRWPSCGLNHYIAAKLLWNVELDVELLLADFYEKFYGDAGQAMQVYYERLDRAFREANACLSPFGLEWTTFAACHFFTPEVLSDLDAAISNAETLAQNESNRIARDRIALIRSRVELTKKFMNYLQVIRAPFEGVDLSDPDAVAAAHLDAISLGEPLSNEMLNFCQLNDISAYVRNKTAHVNINYIVKLAGDTANIIDYVWDDEGDGYSWHDEKNWNLGTYPDYNDANAIIAGDGYEAVVDSATGSVTVRDMYCGHDDFAERGGSLNIQTGGGVDVLGLLYLGGNPTADNGRVSINGGTLNGTEIMTFGSGHEINLNKGEINLTGRILMGWQGDSNSVTTFNITGGNLSATHINLGQTAGIHYLRMTGGTVNLTTNLNICNAPGITAHVQFDGGTISMGNRLWVNRTTEFHGSMDMRGDATLIIGDDWVSHINNWAADGRLTAYGGEGTFVASYNSGTGQTTVTVITKCGYDVPGDLTGDCTIGIADLAILTDSWLSEDGYVDHKLIEDGSVDFFDFASLTDKFPK